MHALLSCKYTCSIAAVDKSAWSQAEDTLIVTTQHELGNRWSHIAAMLPGRTENAVKVRFKSLARLSGASPNGSSRRASSTTTSGTSGSSSSSSQSSAAVGRKKQRRSRSPASSSESDDDDLDDEEEEYVPRPTSRRQQQQQAQQQQQQQPKPKVAPQRRDTARPQRLTAKKPQPVKEEQQLQVVKPEAQLQEQQQQRAPAFDGMVSAAPMRYGTKRLCTEPVKQQQQQQQQQRPLFELPGYTDEHVFAPALQQWRSADQSSVYNEQQHTYQQQLQLQQQQHYQYQQQQQLYYQHQQQLQRQQQYLPAPYSFSSSAYAEPAAVVPAVDPVLQTAFSFDLFGVSEGLAPDLSCFEGQPEDGMGAWNRYCLA
jgi:Myb-like DNA-binding domain